MPGVTPGSQVASEWGCREAVRNPIDCRKSTLSCRILALVTTPKLCIYGGWLGHTTCCLFEDALGGG